MAQKDTEKAGGKLLYQQIMDAIMDQIRAGSFSYDKPICTESELMEQYGVSRITVRRALSELENQGVLYRKRGAGSFVCQDIYQKRPLHAQEAVESATPEHPLFAFVLPFNISRTGLTETYQAASAYLAEKGCMTSIFITEDQGENRARHVLSRLSQLQVAGVAYYPYTANIHQELVDQLLLGGKSVVLMDIPSPCRHIPSVSSDNLRGTLEMMRHLIGLGHQRIAFLTGIKPYERATISDRYSGYLLGQTEAGLRPDLDLICMDMTHAARQLPAEDPKSLTQVIRGFVEKGVTAILCEHDGIAYEALMTCAKMGLKVPEDMSVCGFDKSEWVSVHAGTVITTVAQDYTAIGHSVAELLYQGQRKPLSEHTPQVIPMKLAVGNTTASPQK